MDKFWIAFFSQTGSEIAAISKTIGRKPDLIVTNNVNESKYKVHPDVLACGTVMRASHDRLMEYFIDGSFYDGKDIIITLHGYLRILPPAMCSKYNIYNGHPGAIEQYPELKGKDPQVRTWENKEQYKFVGSVVHKVIPEVDEGEIISSVCTTNNIESLDEMYERLKLTSLSAWSFAMERIL